MPRPAYKITASRPGSDVAGDTAAAFAAGSIVFKDICGGKISYKISQGKARRVDTRRDMQLKVVPNLHTGILKNGEIWSWNENIKVIFS